MCEKEKKNLTKIQKVNIFMYKWYLSYILDYIP